MLKVSHASSPPCRLTPEKTRADADADADRSTKMTSPLRQRVYDTMTRVTKATSDFLSNRDNNNSVVNSCVLQWASQQCNQPVMCTPRVTICKCFDVIVPLECSHSTDAAFYSSWKCKFRPCNFWPNKQYPFVRSEQRKTQKTQPGNQTQKFWNNASKKSHLFFFFFFFPSPHSKLTLFFEP